MPVLNITRCVIVLVQFSLSDVSAKRDSCAIVANNRSEPRVGGYGPDDTLPRENSMPSPTEGANPRPVILALSVIVVAIYSTLLVVRTGDDQTTKTDPGNQVQSRNHSRNQSGIQSWSDADHEALSRCVTDNMAAKGYLSGEEQGSLSRVDSHRACKKRLGLE